MWRGTCGPELLPSVARKATRGCCSFAFRVFLFSTSNLQSAYVSRAMGTLNLRISAHSMLTKETGSKVSYFESENKALRTEVKS